MSRILWLGALLALSVTAGADECVNEVAEGHGVAISGHDLRAEFGFRAFQRICHGEDPIVGGEFGFHTGARDGRRVEIRLPEVTHFNRDGTVAVFSGPGTMVVRTEEGSHDFHGSVVVTAMDLPSSDLTTAFDEDVLHVVFRSDRETFEYQGRVVNGGIEVFAVHVCPCHVSVAEGEGIGEPREGPRSEFRFAVSKRVCEREEPVIDGFFHFSAAADGHGRSITIAMNHPISLNVEGHSAAFAGRALLVLRTEEGTHEIEGNLHVRVRDGKVDSFELAFTSEGFEYSYGAHVVHGDIRVYTRSE